MGGKMRRREKGIERVCKEIGGKGEGDGKRKREEKD